jgi:hypothetical protein
LLNLLPVPGSPSLLPLARSSVPSSDRTCRATCSAEPASTESKERLRPALAPGNVQKTISASVTAIVANDMKFYEKLPELVPHNPTARNIFENSPGPAPRDTTHAPVLTRSDPMPVA